jgi:hypothetical protein
MSLTVTSGHIAVSHSAILSAVFSTVCLEYTLHDRITAASLFS